MSTSLYKAGGIFSHRPYPWTYKMYMDPNAATGRVGTRLELIDETFTSLRGV